MNSAMGRRPGHEFGVERGAHRGRTNEATTLMCRGEDCEVQRKIYQRDGSWLVHECGPEDHNGHEPVHRRAYPWTKEQEQVLDNEFRRGKTLTTKFLMRSLQTAGVANDCTEDDIRRKCHANQVRLGRDRKGCATLEEIQQVIEIFSVAGDTDIPDDQLCVIPLPGDSPYILVENSDTNISEITGQAKPKCLEDETPYVFTIPLASMDSLENVEIAHECVYWELRTVGARDG